MLTFFTTAKAFQGPSRVIQRNALASWRQLEPSVEVILFGDEPGVEEVCAELNLRHERQIERHESGLKYLHQMFQRARRIATHEYLCYSNCDMVFTPDFLAAFEKASRWKGAFLLAGRRWDTNLDQELDFTRRRWCADLRGLARMTGTQQSPDFIDFFVFPRDTIQEMPPLVVGRSYWDQWLIWNALRQGLPVIDASRAILAIHQHHDYAYHPLGKQGTNEDSLAQRNKKLCGEGRHLRSLHDASHAMTASGRIVRTPLRRQMHTLWEFHTRQGWLDHTLRLRTLLGLSRQSTRWPLRPWL